MAGSFFFGFIVPILQNVLKDHIRLALSQTQRVMSVLLSMNIFTLILLVPIVGHFTDKGISQELFRILVWWIRGDPGELNFVIWKLWKPKLGQPNMDLCFYRICCILELGCLWR